MKPLLRLFALFFTTILILASCHKGKDFNEPPIIDTIPKIDTIPNVDTLPTPDTTGSSPDTATGRWFQAVTPPTVDVVQDVFFKNNVTGYAVTSGGAVWKSTDSGFNWTITDQFTKASVPSRIAVTDDNKVFIKIPYFISTSVNDGPFTFQSTNDFQAGYTDVYFLSNDTGYISGCRVSTSSSGCLWKTTDGGISWQQTGVQATSADDYHALTFDAAGNGYQTNGNSVLYKKFSDTLWLPSATVGSIALVSISAPAANIVYAIARDGSVYKSANRAESFTKAGSLTNVSEIDFGYFDISFTNDLTGYAVFQNQLWKTTDGGATWKLTLTSGNVFTKLHFTDPDHGWLCGANGAILVYKR